MRRNAPYDESPFDRPKTGRALLWLILVVVVAFGAFVAGIGFGRLLSTSEDTGLEDDLAPTNSTVLTNTFMPSPTLEQVPVVTTSTATTTPDSTNASTTSSTVDILTPSSTPSTSTTTTSTRDIFDTPRTGTWLRITTTETGYLNVRTTPSPSGALVKRVNPGDEFQYTEQQGEWYKITIDAKTSGWVSGKYVEKIDQ
jgi:hypothetical protein